VKNAIAAALILCWPMTAQESPSTMLRSYLQGIAANELAARKQEAAKIHTREQFERRRAEVRKKILRMIGGLPEERTPLNLSTAGIIDRGDYRVEKIIFESQPRFYVTANLYIPQTGKPPYPAVLHATGHSLSAKARAFYQTLSIGLVKHGFVVLTYDPLGQGERRIFYDRHLEDSKVGGTTSEHLMVGIQSLLAGESIARYMIWDAMRGIDLLQSLPEVNPKRVGVTGCSGGGTLTTQLAALDDRLQVAAPACYITSWEDQLDGTGPQDAEQQFPDQLKEGIDHADFVTAFAPKPYLICSTKEDFFPIEGARKTYQEGKRIYGLFGAEDRISWAVGPGGHGMPLNVREAIYAWMSHWLKDKPGPAPEPRIITEYEEDLLCTPTGQLATSLGGETASSLNIRRLSQLVPPRPVTDLKERVLRLTRYQRSAGALRVETQSQENGEGYRIERLVYHTEPGRFVPALLLTPEPARSRNRSILYVDDKGKSAPDAVELAQFGYTVLALDLAGRGETAGVWKSYSDPWFGQDKIAWLALMVGRPLVGLRMDDILRGVDLLQERNLLYGDTCLGFGKGLSAIDLLHAAVVDSRIAGLTLEGAVISYASIARNPIHRRVFDAVLPGVLTEYDLPDLVSALAPRLVRIVNARSQLGNPVRVRKVRTAYTSANAVVSQRREGEAIADAYPNLP
jgi:dienelactone hydrolase